MGHFSRELVRVRSSQLAWVMQLAMASSLSQVRPLMGTDLIIVVFAVVVIGGMGSIMGSIITGFTIGIVEGLTKYFYPEASNTVVFVLMVLVLLVKPAGLTGRAT